MNLALQSARFVPERGRFVPPLWLDTLGWLSGCVAFVALAAASMPLAGWATNAASRVPVTPPLRVGALQLAAVDAAANDLESRRAGRCPACGIIEIVRTLHTAEEAPAGYELTVRFRDGSRRISSHSDNAGWRVGDSIMLIGGARLTDRV